MVFQLKPGSRLKTSAEVVTAECFRLEQEGRLTARELVNESRPEDAPLHKEFEWDDRIAGERWREHQARHVINSLTVVRENQKPVRAFFNIEVSRPEYVSIQTIVERKDTRQKLLDMALRELEAFKEKYGALSELCEVFTLIDEIRASARQQSKSQQRQKSAGRDALR